MPAIRRSGSTARRSTPRPALIDGTAANTVAWYTGDNATDDPRSTALARADQSLTVSYGARANEQGLRVAVQSLAVFAATQFSGSDPNGEAQYAALRQRVGAALAGSPNQQNVSDIAGQLAGAQVALNNAKDRHDQTNTTLQNLLQERRGRADRAGRGADPVAADEPAGHAADHGDAAARPASCSICRARRCAKSKKPRGVPRGFCFGGSLPGAQARPSRPAAISRLMLISEPR